MNTLKKYKDTDYFVSEQGDVYSSKKNKFRILKKIRNKNGYTKYGLIINKKVHQIYSHRVVGETFLKDYSNELTINHINGIKDDNRVENLQMMTKEENIRDYYNKKVNGLISLIIIKDNEIYYYPTTYQASKDLGINYFKLRWAAEHKNRIKNMNNFFVKKINNINGKIN